MTSATNSTKKDPPQILTIEDAMARVPNKPLLHVTEAVWVIAPVIGRSYAAIERQINRGVTAGRIEATTVLGRRMLTRETVIKLIQGDPE